MKFIRNGRTNRRELIVASQRGETLSTKQAEKLADNASTLLLGFTFEKPRGNGLTTLHYDVEGLWSLRTYLAKRSLGLEELLGLLEATQGVLDLCAGERLYAEGLLFDPEYVFVNAQCCPRFALLPLEGVPFQMRNSPLALLRVLGDTEKLKLATPDAEGLSRRLGDLVVDLEGVFSANRFRRFLEQEKHQGDDAPPEARHSVVDSGTSSVWASAGSGSVGNDATDSSAFFWNPLAGLADEETPKQDEVPRPVEEVTEPVEEASQPMEEQAWADVDAEAVMAPEPVPVAPEPEPESTVAESLAPEPAPVANQPMPTPVVAPNPLMTQVPPAAPVVPPAPVQPAPVIAPTAAPTAPAQTGNLWLVRLSTGERYLLPLGQQVKAGRGSACEIRLLNNRMLSRIHVALTSTGQMVMVTDLGAVNGVYVNGQRVGSMQSVLLMPGQHLRLADEELDVRIG